MRTGYTVRREAREDLESIWQYTLREWGLKQADEYISKVMSKFAWLAENPKAGKQREDIDTKIYSLPVGSHLILYDIINGQPDIVAVLHQSSDVKSKMETCNKQ